MNKRLFSALLALILAMAIVGAACTKPGNQELHSTPETSTTEPTSIQTEEPTQTPKLTPKPTPEPTPPFTALVPENTELDEHDFNAVRSFLELKDENGVRNGEKLNEWYDPDDPTTWWIPRDPPSEYPTYDLVQWNDSGRLYSFSVGDIDFYGALDLSGASELQLLYIRGTHIESVNIEGCDELFELSIRNNPNNIELVPKEIACYRAWFLNCGFKELHWACIMIDSVYVDVSLKAEEGGSVGLLGDDGDIFILYIDAYPDEGKTFVGWFDDDGNLISNEESYRIDVDSMPEELRTFKYTARFE